MDSSLSHLKHYINFNGQILGPESVVIKTQKCSKRIYALKCFHYCIFIGQSSFIQTDATSIPGQIPGKVRDVIHQHLNLGLGPIVVGGKGTRAKTNASMTSTGLDAGVGASGSAAVHMKGAGTTSGMAMEHSVHGAAAAGHSQQAKHGTLQGDMISTGNKWFALFLISLSPELSMCHVGLNCVTLYSIIVPFDVSEI